VLEVAPDAELRARLAEAGFPLAADDDLIVLREVLASGRSSGRINGLPASASQLRELAGALVDVVSQHEAQRLLAPAYALDVVDRFGGAPAVALRDDTAAWLAATFDLPVFLYGPLPDGSVRSLPDVRRGAFRTLTPDYGPAHAHATWGASALGARGLLVAWNLWVRGISLDEGAAIAKAIRRRDVRALAFTIGTFTQISCNLIAPLRVGPSTVYDEVVELLPQGAIDHAELVGLIPEVVLRTQDPARWEQLDVSYEKTIEARVA